MPDWTAMAPHLTADQARLLLYLRDADGACFLSSDVSEKLHRQVNSGVWGVVGPLVARGYVKDEGHGRGWRLAWAWDDIVRDVRKRAESRHRAVLRAIDEFEVSDSPNRRETPRDTIIHILNLVDAKKGA